DSRSQPTGKLLGNRPNLSIAKEPSHTLQVGHRIIQQTRCTEHSCKIGREVADSRSRLKPLRLEPIWNFNQRITPLTSQRRQSPPGRYHNEIRCLLRKRLNDRKSLLGVTRKGA